ncbi:MAG: hypothetical protein AAF629_36715, partial [Chloroflexota bacterium]
FQNQRQQEIAYQQLISVAQDKLTQAKTMDDGTALALIAEVELTLQDAEQLQNNSLEVAQLRTQSAQWVDQVTKVTRLSGLQHLYHYADLGTNTTQLIVDGIHIYVLDTGNQRLYHHRLDQAEGEEISLTTPDRPIDGLEVDQLLSMTVIPPGGNRQTRELSILNSAELLTFRQEDGITRHTLSQEKAQSMPVAIGGYFGNFYLLSPTNDTLLRYVPQPDGYSQAPEQYFSNNTKPDLSEALDMAIDGAIYILYQHGHIEKYWGAEVSDFDLTGLDKPFDQPRTIFTDLDEILAHVYVVDYGNQRIVQLQKNGHFVRQFKPSHNGAVNFNNLQDIVVDERNNRMFILNDNNLYLSPLN